MRRFSHVKLVDGESRVHRVTSDQSRSEVCEDLGYHPSDIMQSNCVNWVEGPSDRVYLNFWLEALNNEWIEGIHYSIMFYGGRLASHLSGNDLDSIADDLISLRRLNRRSVILIDSDRKVRGGKINKTKERLRKEFDSGKGFAWITTGREIENYLTESIVMEALKNTAPTAKPLAGFTRYDQMLAIKAKGGKDKQASKMGIARYVASNSEPDLRPLDLMKQIRKLDSFIRDSNMSEEE